MPTLRLLMPNFRAHGPRIASTKVFPPKGKPLLHSNSFPPSTQVKPGDDILNARSPLVPENKK